MAGLRIPPVRRRPIPRRHRPSRKYLLERVGDAAVVQLYADGFRDLPLAEKTLIWHLYQAALAGRDIFYDQKHARSLEMRDVLEAIIAAPGIEPSDARGDPPVHETVLDQQRSVQQQERAQVRVDLHPGSVRGRSARRGKGGRDVPDGDR